MAQTLNATASTFVPGANEHHAIEALLEMGGVGIQDFINDVNFYINEQQNEPNNNTEQQFEEVSEQAEFEDAFLEYAYENGLWGLPGSEHEPSENEFTDMRQRFADHYINIHGYNENLDYGINIESEEEETDEEYEEEYENDEGAENDGGDNGYDDENAPTTWEELAVDFQDFVDYRRLMENMSTVHYSELDNAWDFYLENEYHPAARNWINQLGDAHNWIGVYTEEQLANRENDYSDYVDQM